MITLTSGNDLIMLNMHEFTTEKKVVALLNSKRKTGLIILRTLDGKIKIRFRTILRARHEPRIFYKNIMVNADTFLNVFAKREKDVYNI